MKPIPYSVEDFKPWDFQFAQRLGVLENALRQVIDVVGSHSPATQEALTQVIQSLDQGNIVAHEMAATSTMVSYGQLVLQSLNQDQQIQNEIIKHLHMQGILPLLRQGVSPLALPAAAFYALPETFQRQEPTQGEASPAVRLDTWYQDLVWESYNRGEVRLVANASIFNSPSNGTEHALVIGIWHSTALVILLDQPRIQFLHMHREKGGAATLVVTGYSHLLAIFNEQTPDMIIGRLKADIQNRFLAHLPESTVEQLNQDVDEELAEYLVKYSSFSVDTAMSAPVVLGHGQTCTIRRASHGQLGVYTSIALSTGEVVARDDVANTVYFAAVTKEKTELTAVTFEQLPNVSKAILLEGLKAALSVFEAGQTVSLPEEAESSSADRIGPAGA